MIAFLIRGNKGDRAGWLKASADWVRVHAVSAGAALHRAAELGRRSLQCGRGDLYATAILNMQPAPF